MMLARTAFRATLRSRTALSRRTVANQRGLRRHLLPRHAAASSATTMARRFFSDGVMAPQKDEPGVVYVIASEEEEAEEASGDLMSPRLIVEELDRHIVGQGDAKRAVAVALRNRWRRQQLDEAFRGEVTPKNLLMIGPTGCGKTEIARRLANLAESPFVKVEATKFTEVGFHGRDVDTIIRDLIEASILLVRKKIIKEIQAKVDDLVCDELADLQAGVQARHTHGELWESTRESIARGDMDSCIVEIQVPVKSPQNSFGVIDASSGGSMSSISDMFKQLNGNRRETEPQKMTIKEARPILNNKHQEKLLETRDIKGEAIALAEESGIVVIDEIDKICSIGEYRSADASAEGVQRDLLPLVEGSVVSTKHGNVSTDHILFVCSGAFHNCKPADLLPELQGRLPIRVELQGLGEDELHRILTEPEVNVIEQQRLLLATEDVDLVFEEDAVREVAKLAAEMNQQIENIGARRLHTVMERIMDDISFEAADMPEGTQVVIDVDRVRERLEPLMEKNDLSKFIL